MKPLGILLIITAVVCVGIALSVGNERNVVEEISARLAAKQADLEQSSIVVSQERAQRVRAPYVAEREKKKMLWLGGAALSFLAGIICLASPRKNTLERFPSEATQSRHGNLVHTQPLSIEWRLSRLGELRQDGLISEQEYADKRRDILNEI